MPVPQAVRTFVATLATLDPALANLEVKSEDDPDLDTHVGPYLLHVQLHTPNELLATPADDTGSFSLTYTDAPKFVVGVRYDEASNQTAVALSKRPFYAPPNAHWLDAPTPGEWARVTHWDHHVGGLTIAVLEPPTPRELLLHVLPHGLGSESTESESTESD
jgi:hypothetical protein